MKLSNRTMRILERVYSVLMEGLESYQKKRELDLDAIFFAIFLKDGDISELWYELKELKRRKLLDCIKRRIEDKTSIRVTYSEKLLR